MTAPLIVGFGGTTRAGSSGEKMVRAVLAETERLGATTRMFGGSALAALPHYAPENPARTAEQREFVEAARAADGFVIGSPGYHGSISGLVKNAIDLLEDNREGVRPYFDGRAVGLIVVAAGWQACGITLSAMRGIVHAMRGWPTPYGITINTVEQKPFDEAGNVVDPKIKSWVEGQAQQVMYFASHSVPKVGDDEAA